MCRKALVRPRLPIGMLEAHYTPICLVVCLFVEEMFVCFSVCFVCPICFTCLSYRNPFHSTCFSPLFIMNYVMLACTVFKYESNNKTEQNKNNKQRKYWSRKTKSKPKEACVSLNVCFYTSLNVDNFYKSNHACLPNIFQYSWSIGNRNDTAAREISSEVACRHLEI